MKPVLPFSVQHLNNRTEFHLCIIPCSCPGPTKLASALLLILLNGHFLRKNYKGITNPEYQAIKKVSSMVYA